MGFVFTKVSPNKTIKDEKENAITEVDIILEDGDKVMLIEVKPIPNIENVRDHISCMEKVRLYADLHNDKRKYMGAVAGMFISDNVAVVFIGR